MDGADKLKARAELQAIRDAELKKRRDAPEEYVKARRGDLAAAAAREGATSKRRRTHTSPAKGGGNKPPLDPTVIQKGHKARQQL